MTNRSKDKGTWAERCVADYLAEVFPGVDRHAQHGATDLGDLINVPSTAVEVKAREVYAFPQWLREAEIEGANAAAPFYVVVAKPRGVGEKRIGRWWALTHLDNYTEMLKRAVAV